MAKALSRGLGSGALSRAALGINDEYTMVYNKPHVMLRGRGRGRGRYMTMMSYVVHKVLDNDLSANDSSLMGLKSNELDSAPALRANDV